MACRRKATSKKVKWTKLRQLSEGNHKVTPCCLLCLPDAMLWSLVTGHTKTCPVRLIVSRDLSWESVLCVEHTGLRTLHFCPIFSIGTPFIFFTFDLHFIRTKKWCSDQCGFVTSRGWIEKGWEEEAHMPRKKGRSFFWYEFLIVSLVMIVSKS